MALYHLKKYVLPKCPPKCPPSPPKMSSQKSSQTEMGGQILPFGRTLVTLLHMLFTWPYLNFRYVAKWGALLSILFLWIYNKWWSLEVGQDRHIFINLFLVMLKSYFQQSTFVHIIHILSVLELLLALYMYVYKGKESVLTPFIHIP